MISKQAKSISSKFSKRHTKVSQFLKTTDHSSIARKVEGIFCPFDVAFWIHGIGFSEKFRKYSSRSWSSVVTSVVLGAFFDAHAVYYVTFLIFSSGVFEGKRAKMNVSDVVVIVTSLLSRFWFYVNRNKLKFIVDKISRLYIILGPQKRLNFKKLVVKALFLADVFFLIFLALRVLALVHNPKMTVSAPGFYFGTFNPELSYILMLAFNFGFFWGVVIHPYTVYFCFVCYIIRKTLLEFKKMLLQDRVPDYYKYFQFYSKITKTILVINEFLHTMNLFTFLYLLTVIFFHVFHLVFFGSDNTYDLVRRIMQMTLYSTCFISICVASSSVEAANAELRNSIHQLSNGQCDGRKLSLVLKTEESVRFTILDSIVINKGLILDSFGILFSYGLMIATFETY